MQSFRFQVSSSKLRRGVSLIEVLFAILVTTIGLFGALALLPVASSQARKGRINDATAVAAMTCVHEFDARGMRRGMQSWVAYDSTLPGFRLVSQLAIPYGASFCIDPRFIGAHDVTPARRNGARQFPYNPAAGEAVMLRATLSNNAPIPSQMTKLQADSIFSISDDLTYDRPDDNSLAPTQTFEDLPSAAGTKARRQTDGHMSWMATLVPRLERYTAAFNETYVLSIVVFYDRPASFGYDEGLGTFTLPDERSVDVFFTGGGIGGGEVRLEAATEAALNLRPNDWVMLSGIVSLNDINPGAPGEQPGLVPTFKWYRVSDTEAEVTNNGTNYERYVTLAGPDWDTTATNPRAVIVEGVVGVYEKTIRLE